MRRLAEKGFTPERKIQRSDPGEALSKKRIAFALKHKDPICGLALPPPPPSP